MQTRRKKAQSLREFSQAQGQEDEGKTLLSLPDVPLLMVLAYLPPQDLISAGQAVPRLGKLTHTHPALWLGKKFVNKHAFDSIAELLGVVRVLPPVSNFTYRVERELGAKLQAQFNFLKRKPPKQARTSLALEGPNVESCVALLRHIKPSLEVLGISRFNQDLEMLLQSLQDSPVLSILELNFGTYAEKCAYMWPEEKALPGLRWMRIFTPLCPLECCRPDPSVLETLRSVLRAHRASLALVHLGCYRMLPLLDACSSTLPEVHLLLDEDQLTSMQHLRGLKRLSITAIDEETCRVIEVLESCTGPLVRLQLSNCSDRVVRSLGSLGPVVSRLRHLELSPGELTPWRRDALTVALAGMPKLQTLIVRHLPKAHAHGLLAALPAATIPQLSVVVLVWDSEVDSCQPAGKLVSRACQSLVRRAPRPLHVAVSFGRPAEPEAVLFFEHPEETAAGCALCASAANAVTEHCGVGAKISLRVRVR